MRQNHESTCTNSAPYRGLLLVAAFTLIGIIWCAVLPWIASLPRIHQQLTFLNEQGIDPSAMFYTELEAMDRILDDQERSPNVAAPPTK